MLALTGKPTWNPTGNSRPNKFKTSRNYFDCFGFLGFLWIYWVLALIGKSAKNPGGTANPTHIGCLGFLWVSSDVFGLELICWNLYGFIGCFFVLRCCSASFALFRVILCCCVLLRVCRCCCKSYTFILFLPHEQKFSKYSRTLCPK